MELMNAVFDEKSRELVTLAKGRGLTDCGIQTRWRFDGQRFRLVRYAEEPSCDGWAWARCLAHAMGSRVDFLSDDDAVVIRRCRHQAFKTLCAFSTMFSTVKPK